MCSYKLSLPRRICCCCDLSTGGMVLGWLGGITYFVNMIMGITTLTQNTVIELPRDMKRVDQEIIELVVRVIFVLDIIVSFVNMIGCICLMIGTIKRRNAFIKPWLFGQIFVIFTWTIVDLVLITLVLGKYSTIFAVSLFVVTLGIGIILYLWICMYAFYKKLCREESLLSIT